MKDSFRPRGTAVLASLAISAVLLLGTTWAAQEIRTSGVYSKSRIISMLVTQEQIDITDFAGNKRNVDMMLKFAGALTSAYINFELIPVNEVATFVTVFESVGLQVEIESFAYHRKDLVITGNAPSRAAYTNFRDALRATGYFEEVQEEAAVDGETVHFELECVSRSAPVYLELPLPDL